DGAAAADADRVKPDPRLSGDPGSLARVDYSGVAVAVGEQDDHLALGFRPPQAVDRDCHAVADRGGQLLLQRLGIDHLSLVVADRPGDLESLHDVDKGAMVEGQGTLAVGE